MQRVPRYDGVDGPRVAIAHDYLTQRGGAEKVVLSMSRAFPNAPIYTMLYDPGNTYPEFADLDVRVSKFNMVAPLRKNHRAALPVLPAVANSMFIDADVVVTSSSGWAHGFRTNGRKLVHCHSPARWLYLPEMYLGDDSSVVKRAGLAVTTPYLRRLGPAGGAVLRPLPGHLHGRAAADLRRLRHRGRRGALARGDGRDRGARAHR